MNISSHYIPGEAEKKWYPYWEHRGLFHSEPDKKPSFTIVIPPPNVTGVLHMGHMLNNTIQDILIRRARMTGKNACWVPGTDHASIATEAKVVEKLKSEGIDKNQLSREEFLTHAWAWKEQYGGTILSQLKKLGSSCDWERTKFTMDPELSAQVIKSFVKLYEDGLIYRGKRMINWDPKAKTNISDEEVIYKEVNSKLFYLKYFDTEGKEFLEVATTRPETIFGDVAVCVNPDDEKYTHWIGKKVIVPYVGREIPVIADEYVDPAFGTGVLKITPAHDINDYEIGTKHHLDIIDCLDDDAHLNHHAGEFAGKNRFVVRRELAAKLEALGLLSKVESHPNKVGTSERTGEVIEPKISNQWFLKMETLAKPALDAVMNGEIQFHPEKYKNTYRHWMENIRDWNISRQLWWGQQIPAYFYGDHDEFVVAESPVEALQKAIAASGNSDLKMEDLRQDPDVLDTWFSSWLWPMSVFNGITDPENPEYKYYYPTQDLVTGPDIIFFWVARMVMAGLYFDGKVPFKNVYFTGIVRDKEGRKMSKSLGNSPDTLELIDTYGADAVRAGILLSSAAGNDLLYDESLIKQGRNFSTKIWNAFKLVKGWQIAERKLYPYENEAIECFAHQLNAAKAEIASHFQQYRISDALKSVYSLIWDDFCAWYLEWVKPGFQEGLPSLVIEKTLAYFEEILQVLHPFMPFISEEIWHNIQERPEGSSIMISQLHPAESADKKILDATEIMKEMTSSVRMIRQKQNLSPKEKLEVLALEMPKHLVSSFERLANASLTQISAKPEQLSEVFTVGTAEFFVPLQLNMDVEEEKAKAQEELEYQKGFLNSVMKKLGNEKFMAGAPAAVVETEMKKKADAEEKIKNLEERLSQLNS